MKKLSCLLLLFSQFCIAQFGFCEGSKGDPIFTEDFGSGTNYGPALPAGVTNYTFVTDKPEDGSYTIYYKNDWVGWHNNIDHTPGDTNGKLLIVNASYTAGEFYTRTVSGLCENTSYEFSSWLINLLPANTSCGGGGIPINVKFQILNAVDNSILAEGDTGNLNGTSSPRWEQYALTFTTPPGQTNVILKMVNNGAGGCGNDLGIDDIMFRSCGDLTTISDSVSAEQYYATCETSGPVNLTLNATPDNSVYQTHAFQWQESSDGLIWYDIPAATNSTYNVVNLVNSTLYRVKVAEDNINLQNALCYTVSNLFAVHIDEIPDPPTLLQNVTVCENETIQNLEVSVDVNQTVDWYTTSTGGTPIYEGHIRYITNVPGTYYAETRTTFGGCTSIIRTPVTLTINPVPNLVDEEITFCKEVSQELDAGVSNATYLWSTGETTQQIYVEDASNYTVTVTTAAGCSASKTFTTYHYETPVITNITSEDDKIIVSLENYDGFEYSLDGITYQNSPVFERIRGNYYTVYVRNIVGCPDVKQNFIHLEIPKFFTPNGDFRNDVLQFFGMENFTPSNISIYNRYGNLIISGSGTDFIWDGTFNGKPLPSSDYWYKITFPDNTIKKGHIALKR